MAQPGRNSQAAQTAQPISPVQFRWRSLAQIKPDLTVKPVVRGLLDTTGLSRCYGPPNEGKTLITVDLALHIALNLDWCGLRVNGGPVVYLCTEAPYSLERRVEAFCRHHSIDREQVPFYMLEPADFDIRRRVDVEALIHYVSRKHNVAPALVTIDTQNQSMPGTDEREVDMGIYHAHTKLIRDKLNCHVMSVHHSGKDLERGGRGSSVGLCNVDTEFQVTGSQNTPIHTLKVEKQREGNKLVLCFERVLIPIGIDAYGDPVGSVAVNWLETPPPDASKRPTGQAAKALDLLRELAQARDEDGKVRADWTAGEAQWRPVPRSEWEAACKGKLTKGNSRNADRNAFSAALTKLEEKGFIRWQDTGFVPV